MLIVVGLLGFPLIPRGRASIQLCFRVRFVWVIREVVVWGCKDHNPIPYRELGTWTVFVWWKGWSLRRVSGWLPGGSFLLGLLFYTGLSIWDTLVCQDGSFGRSRVLPPYKWKWSHILVYDPRRRLRPGYLEWAHLLFGVNGSVGHLLGQFWGFPTMVHWRGWLAPLPLERPWRPTKLGW